MMNELHPLISPTHSQDEPRIAPSEVPGMEVKDVASAFAVFYSTGVGLLVVTPEGRTVTITPYAANVIQCIAPQIDFDAVWTALRAQVAGLEAYLKEPPKKSVAFGTLVELPAGQLAADPVLIFLQVRPATEDHLQIILTDCSSLLARERMRFKEQLHETVHSDPLTGLASRQAVMEYVNQKLSTLGQGASGGGLVLTKLNIREFNSLNLAYGSEICDQLLLHVAHLLMQHAASIGLLGRVGSDEFVIVALSQNIDDTIDKISQLVHLIQDTPYPSEKGPIRLNFTVGFAPTLNASTSAESLLTQAKAALHVAKTNPGRSSKVFQESYVHIALRRQYLENAMRDSLARGHAGFEVYYQPQAALPSGDWVGVEALIRWQLPDGERVSPAEFIPVAEQSGLIIALGQWVLDQALLAQIRVGEHLGGHWYPKMAVNVSPLQLKSDEFVEFVRNRLAAHPLPLQQVQLEITESAAPQGSKALSRLQKLKQLGVRVALDDFGTGFSSLASLHLFNVDVIKIDQSFVADLDTNAYKKALVESMVKVAQSLKLNTVAEGVETLEQKILLHVLGCDIGQGYLFSKPLPLAQLLPGFTQAKRLGAESLLNNMN